MHHSAASSAAKLRRAGCCSQHGCSSHDHGSLHALKSAPSPLSEHAVLLGPPWKHSRPESTTGQAQHGRAYPLTCLV